MLHTLYTLYLYYDNISMFNLIIEGMKINLILYIKHNREWNY